MHTFNVIRCENRSNGSEEVIATINSETLEQAQLEAAGQCECDDLHHLIVVEVTE